jgi:hypothetical protein
MKILSNLLIITSLLTACDKDRNKPGYSYFPDMEQSRSYETYSENPVLPGGKTNLIPVKHTVPRGAIPYHFEKTEENRKLAGHELINPYLNNPDDSALMKEGKRLYTIFCWHCHGEKGDGNGHLYTSGKYTFKPASLISDKIKSNPDGEIFHVISIGFGVMGAHQGQIMADERWKIVWYIKNYLQE